MGPSASGAVPCCLATRRTRQMEALIASAYLSGTCTRRVQRALAALPRGAVGKDVANRAWRRVRVDGDA